MLILMIRLIFCLSQDYLLSGVTRWCDIHGPMQEPYTSRGSHLASYGELWGVANELQRVPGSSREFRKSSRKPPHWAKHRHQAMAVQGGGALYTLIINFIHLKKSFVYKKGRRMSKHVLKYAHIYKNTRILIETIKASIYTVKHTKLLLGFQ